MHLGPAETAILNALDLHHRELFIASSARAPGLPADDVVRMALATVGHRRSNRNAAFLGAHQALERLVDKGLMACSRSPWQLSTDPPCYSIPDWQPSPDAKRERAERLHAAEERERERERLEWECERQARAARAVVDTGRLVRILAC